MAMVMATKAATATKVVEATRRANQPPQRQRLHALLPHPCLRLASQWQMRVVLAIWMTIFRSKQARGYSVFFRYTQL